MSARNKTVPPAAAVVQPAPPIGDAGFLLPAQSWFVYVLRCADGSLYVGITTDLSRRLAEHNGTRTGGARYTRSRRPVQLVWHEPHPDRAAASRREAALKRLSRTAKEQLIAQAGLYRSDQAPS